MEESEDTEVNFENSHKQPGAVPSIFNASKDFSKNLSEETVAMKPDEKFLEMHEAVSKSVHYLRPSFEWSAYASSQFIIWSTYSADGSEILKRIVLSPNMRIRVSI